MGYWENLGYSTTLLVWKKLNAIPFGNGKYVSDAEFIIYVREKGCVFNNVNIKEKSKFYEYSANNIKLKREHPTEKPILLLERILKIHSKEQDIVLDPFAGSGTTGIACINTNRNYILIEKEKKYYDIINDRIAELNNKLF